MAPKPTVDEKRVRALLTTEEGERRTANEVARLLTKELADRDKPVNPTLIRSLIGRRTWNLPPAPKIGRPTVMEYLVDAALGPFMPEHSDLTTLHKLRRWERIGAGLASPDGKHGQAAIHYVERLLNEGEVTAYCPQAGFSTRPALPWEFGHYFTQPEPPTAMDQVRKWLTGWDKGRTTVADPPLTLTDDHADQWLGWLRSQKE